MTSTRRAIRVALCAAATVLPTAGAWALTPAQVSALSTTNIVYISGSTATDKAIQAWAKLDPAKDANAPFKAGTYDLYTTAASKGYVLTGTAGPVFGALSGTNIAIVKQTAGGSAIGIHNVAQGIAAPGFPDLSSPSSSAFVNTCGSPTASTASSPFQAFNTYACTLESATIVPNGGISDEDPTTWIGTGGVTASDVTALTGGTKPAVQVPFAIIVSTALRNQLQSLEGLTSGSETLANVPSLSSAQIRTILSQQVTTLAHMYVFNPTSKQTGQVDPTGSFVHLCRRGDTSGSQFAANIRFMGKGCLKGNGVGAVANPDTASSQANGEGWTGSATQISDLVFAGAGTGDVVSCVSSPIDSTDGDTVNYRVGFVSTDQAPTAAWRYIAVDGVAPTIWNIQLGLYDWMMQDSFNQTTTSMGLNGGPGNHATIFNTIQANLSNVNALAGLNATTQNAAASADTTAAADTGIVTTANSVLYGASDTTGPSAPNWPAAIRAIAVAGQGPNSPINKTYPSSAENNCNGAYVSDPTG